MKAEWGDKLASKLKQRLMELSAAETLEQISRLPPARCHELKENYKGKLAVTLKEQYRLIFEVGNDPRPCLEDGGLDWEKVTEVVILEVVDYH
ncbi:MAG: type II toxin-antitoxin system RelE/ParE family toxin [Phycisphaeraceae bacterium JB051]